MRRVTSLEYIRRTQSGTIWQERNNHQMFYTFHQNMLAPLWAIKHSYLRILCILQGTSNPWSYRDFEKFIIQTRSHNRDLLELETSIYSKYQEMASNIRLQKQDLSKHCHELKASTENQAENWHNCPGSAS